MSTATAFRVDLPEQRIGLECYEAAREYLLTYQLAAVALCSWNHLGERPKHNRGCSSHGKAPIMKGWSGFGDELPTTEDLDGWWDWDGHCRPRNVGVICGPASQLLAVDMDGEFGREEFDRQSKVVIPATWHFPTFGGARLLFRVPDGVRLHNRSFKGNGDHQELKYIARANTVMPPSMHFRGVRYTWTPGHAPGEIEAALVPGWMIDLLRDDRSPTSVAVPGDIPSSNGHAGKHKAGKFPLANADKVAFHCPAIRAVKEARSDGPKIGYDHWFLTSTVVRCEDGPAEFHKWSKAGDARYDPAQTQRMIDGTLAAGGPARCERFKNATDGSYCAGCYAKKTARENGEDFLGPIFLGEPDTIGGADAEPDTENEPPSSSNHNGRSITPDGGAPVGDGAPSDEGNKHSEDKASPKQSRLRALVRRSLGRGFSHVEQVGIEDDATFTLIFVVSGNEVRVAIGKENILTSQPKVRARIGTVLHEYPPPIKGDRWPEIVGALFKLANVLEPPTAADDLAELIERYIGPERECGRREAYMRGYDPLNVVNGIPEIDQRYERRDGQPRRFDTDELKSFRAVDGSLYLSFDDLREFLIMRKLNTASKDLKDRLLELGFRFEEKRGKHRRNKSRPGRKWWVHVGWFDPDPAGGISDKEVIP